MNMEVPVIDFSELDGENRSKVMEQLHTACQTWGCFKIKNHGIDKKVMEKIRHFVNTHYEENLKSAFYESEIAKCLRNEFNPDVDWETSFFIWHRPKSNIEDFPNLTNDLREAIDKYVSQLISLAEMISELMCENLGLEKDYIKKAFSGANGPSVGTKLAKTPQCTHPERVRGLREHTDAGGIIFLLQDDQVPGLEFLHEGKYVPIPPSTNDTIFVNTGDQVEVLTNGKYKSIWHRVLVNEHGSRLSVVTFYNPAPDAVISPAPKLLYPDSYRFGDYLKHYNSTKFQEKEPRFEFMKKMENGCNGVAM